MAVSETSHGMQLTIREVSKLDAAYTSEVFVHGIPWKVKIFKDTDEGSVDDSSDDEDENDKSWFAVRLICTNNDDSLKWSVAGAASFKLIPFTNDAKVLESNCVPSVFGRTSLNGVGFCQLIQWNDLFADKNGYIKDDTIKLEINIEAENPNDPNRSSLHLKRVEKDCSCGSSATFQLIVKNVSKLMALQVPQFDLRGLPWKIVIGKEADSLFTQLYHDEPTTEISCPATWTVKLLSSKANVDSIEEFETESELSSNSYLKMAIVS